MKTSCKLFPLLSCLLFVCSIAYSGVPPEEAFDFLNHYKNASLVEDGLGLLNSAGASIFPTAISTGLWYGVCKGAGFVSNLASGFKLGIKGKQELGRIKTGFCARLAPAFATTETVLAGHVSPWPLEQAWWQTLRLAGAGLIAFGNYDRRHLDRAPLGVLAYLSAEATARSVAGAVSTQALRSQGIFTVSPSDYTYGEYTVLSFISGTIVGSIAYEAMIARGSTPARASFVYAVSAALTGAISAIISTSTFDLDNWLIVGAGTEAAAIVAAVAVAAAGVGAVAGTVAEIEARAGAGAGVGAGAGAGAITGAGAVTGAIAGVGAGTLFKRYSLTSNNIMTNAAIALPLTLTLILVNSCTNYAIYGFPLEESLSETTRNQWQKFYEPLDYLSTLLN